MVLSEHYHEYDRNDNAASREERTIEELIAWLNYPGMDQRREAVEDAHKNTFQWIFGAVQADARHTNGMVTGSRPRGCIMQQEETSFATWLRQESGVFWIHGKPGAGKSTLMKCIMEDPRLKQHANVWAGPQQLSVSSFYFWKHGSKIQRSLCGLYRALLWQVLKDDPSLTRVAFPSWQMSFSATEPILETLRAALNRLIKGCVLRKKFLILIDGLDEYEDHKCDVLVSQERFSQDILRLAESRSVKVLIASRPDRAFESHFSHCRKIAVHDLTAWDIELFARDRLIKDGTVRPPGEDLSEQESEHLRWLVRYMAVKSQGVFLWTRIVVEMLRVQIRDHDSIDELEKTITELPPDLEELFDQIMDRILNTKISKKVESLRYLALTTHWFATFADNESSPTHWLPIAILSIGCAQRSEKITDSWLGDNTERLTRIGRDESRISGRVKSCCFGLLETSDREVEGFLSQTRSIRRFVRPLHRTLVEYISHHAAIQRAQNLSLPGHDFFDANTAILLGLIVMGEFMYPLVNSPLSSLAPPSLFQIVLIFNKLAEKSTGSAHIAILSAFDRIIKAGFTALVGKNCHLDHDHKARCATHTLAPPDWRSEDHGRMRAFSQVVQEFALNPSHPLTSRTHHPEGFLDLTAVTITCHCNALLKQRMDNPASDDTLSRVPISADHATRLLGYALSKRNLVSIYSFAAKPDVLTPNVEALQLLLRLGACLETRIGGASAWERFLDDLLDRAMERATSMSHRPRDMDKHVHLGLEAFHFLVSRGARLDVHLIWAVIFRERGTSPGPARVVEFRRYSVVQVVCQILDTLHHDSKVYQRHHASEITELQKLRHHVEQWQAVSPPNRVSSWSDLQDARDVTIGPYLDWRKMVEALTISHEKGLDIAKHQQFQAGSSLPTTWLPRGCRETHELPNDLVVAGGKHGEAKGKYGKDRPTLMGDDRKVNYDVVGWLVYGID